MCTAWPSLGPPVRSEGRGGEGGAMRTVAVTNAKGGVGKSTTAINLAAALVELDQRVLLIDADPSGNATLGYFPKGATRDGLADMLLDEAPLEEGVRATRFHPLAVLPPAARLTPCSDP